MADEEYDYMSDDIIAKCNDIRPGLVHNTSLKRKFEIEKHKVVSDEKNKKLFRPLKQIEDDHRNEGLNKALEESNKGFAMLKKMGYKQGQAIGKFGSGSVAPIEISIKTDRKGLGREAAIKEITERKATIKAQYLKISTNTDDFRLRMAQKVTERQNEGDLKKSQFICKQLDEENDVKEPDELWFWPEEKKVNDDDEEEEDDDEEKNEEVDIDEFQFTTADKLEMLTRYLRIAYCYCIWCAVKFNDTSDMENDCPGSTRADH